MRLSRIKKHYSFCIFLIIITTITLWLLILNTNNESIEYTNRYGSKIPIVPNIIHYIIFNKNEIDLITYLSIISALKIQHPHSIYIHSNNINFYGKYWEKLHSINTNTSISLLPMKPPTHVFGQLLSSVYHSSDIARIEILLKYGGIYLDTDVLIINNFDALRCYNMVVGWPSKEYMGTQVLFAAKPNLFLSLWLEGYRKYHPRDWYYNAGVVPTEIMHSKPYIAHYETELLGVQNLLDKLHGMEDWDWKKYYTIHLLSRHSEGSTNLTEEALMGVPTNFGKIARWILSL